MRRILYGKSKLFFILGMNKKEVFKAVLNRGKIKLPRSVCKIGAGKMVNFGHFNFIHCTLCILADQTHICLEEGPICVFGPEIFA